MVSLVLGMAIGRYEWLPINRVADVIRSMRYAIEIRLVGEDKFVHKKLEKHYRASNPPQIAATRTLDTSRLPLALTSFPLANTGQFATGGLLIGGALAKVEKSLFAMDKLGNIFDCTDSSLHRMDYGAIPNGIGDLLKKSVQPSSLTAFRALYIAYDGAHGTIYVSLLRFHAATGHTRFNVSAISIDQRTLGKTGDWRTVFESEDIPDDLSYRGATGGKLIVAGNFLYFTIGDFNFGQLPETESGLLAQNRSSSCGKIYEHDLTTKQTRMKSIGHRNPQGLVFTREGRLIDTEHGPEGGDELNIIVDGHNYGWPYRTHGTDYGTFNWPVKFKAPAVEFAEPLYAWVPSAAISPVIQVTGFNERWDGDLLVGSLKAQTLFRLRMDQDRVIFSEPIWIGHRIRDIVQMPGQIVLMTDDPSLIFVSIDEARLKHNSKMEKNAELAPALQTCLTCHHFGETNPSHLAPSLANILGKRTASDRFERYSEALTKKGGSWDEESLARFITDPNAFAPGSGMPNPGLSVQQIKDVVSALRPRALN